MRRLFKEMVGFGGKFIAYPIIVTIISIAHYAFALMHTLFEFSMWLFNKPQFRTNLILIDQNMKAKELSGMF